MAAPAFIPPPQTNHHDLMCMVMHECERVGLDFVDSAPYRFVSTVDLAITPEQLFEVLADETSWPRWASVITKVTWTSPLPRGVGTTRTVDMRGGITGAEEFLAWEPFERMAFRFNTATTGSIAAFAEDYRVVPTPTGCHLTWIMAMKPAGLAGRLGLFAGRPVMGRLFQRFLHNLRRYTDERFAAR
ncbi:Polyketide cyclase / dehydrase and lipid transport [Mycolicibacterium chlorophenolicum]|uniref:Polyketide cyclase / dehydrase and lipid transport n=2 Tax=Mycolicibacterium chlorophenolicum TaxID=37916 RepID=A0A0J6W935_9MYCO|nr:Polyketide cyclase / dehydrase and lipid transport [Mycolicibacterium chlorophenolicum]